MSRQPRKISKSGMYHVIFRGANKQDIFQEESDYIRLKNIIFKVKQENNIKIYAYCFMTNHVHMFVCEPEPGALSLAMKKILTSYSVWYNRKYMRTGPLVEGRYKSEPVEDDAYIINLVKYIHQNPLKAFVTNEISQYEYSSYNEYLGAISGLADTEFVLEMIGSSPEMAREEFISIHKTIEEDWNETDSISKMKLSGTISRILKMANCNKLEDIKDLSVKQKNTLVCKIISELKISKSELSGLIGISRNTITTIIKTCQKGDVPQNDK